MIVSKRGNEDIKADSESVQSDYNMLSNLFEWSEVKELQSFAFKKYKNQSMYKGSID